VTAVLLLAASLAAAAPAPETFPAPRADKRVELLGMVRLLAHDERAGAAFYGRDLPYEAELARRLEPLSSHPVVERWGELERTGLNYVAAYQWVLTLGEPPGLQSRGDWTGNITRAAGGAEGLEEFRLMLADFARAADFDRLYAETAPLRDPMIDDARAQAATGGIREEMERYWGGPVRLRYSLIVSPFLESALAVTELTQDADGTPRLTSVTGAEDLDGRVAPRLSRRRGTLWAESINEALKPVSAVHAARLKASAGLLAATGVRCAANWEECSRREISFAVAGRLLESAGDKTSSDELPIKYGRVGMPHLGPLIAALKVYEKDRKRWKTLPAYYPKLLDVFDGLAVAGPSTAPFAGGIAAALADPAPCVLIAPSSPSPAVAAALARFRRERRLCEEELTGEQALQAALAGKALIAVGGPQNNAWLKARWDALQLPAHLEGGGVRMNPRPDELTGTVYEGRIGFVSSARSPEDSARPVLIVASADPTLLPALLKDFSEASDYEIRDGGTLVKTGMYEKSRLPWRTK
jgi:hypothetical protein